MSMDVLKNKIRKLRNPSALTIAPSLDLVPPAILAECGDPVRAMGNPAYGAVSSPFTDVTDPKAFYYNAVLWAVENGITNGMGNNQFGIGSICNRAQVVTFLYRTFQ